MKKVFLGVLGLAVLLTSCVSQKKYADLEAKHKEAQDLLNSATVKLNDCLEEKATATSKMKALEEQMKSLSSNLSSLNGVYGGMLSAMNRS